ncbi:hypothetical protein JTE90_025250 [Oedothorax gibbosus]|uniref:Transposable element P transposase n=1 Tax=Oedothorax gibbosus TaxID=931172 RepID=A0AAV6U6W1_9ARAC|nr:hypothetical protein JTE90_025250 [Oedothorax gibbosus]
MLNNSTQPARQSVDDLFPTISSSPSAANSPSTSVPLAAQPSAALTSRSDIMPCNQHVLSAAKPIKVLCTPNPPSKTQCVPTVVKAILISTESLCGLLKDFKNMGFKYLLTSRLTQDALESLFSQIRGVGNFYDHPSPVEVISRLKNLLLANRLPALPSKANTQEQETIPAYLTADI